ncbi:MAG: hypothetical protein B7X75_05375, partial [Sphingobacteriales bacterium 39-40-5]
MYSKNPFINTLKIDFNKKYIMRKKIVAGNWKMNMGLKEGIALFSEISELVKAEVKGDQGVIVCPPFIHISSLVQ